jgi:AcrR family transcriptional regulator
MEDKRIQIYNAGKELFSTRGFKDTNVSDITKAAGVAVGTFYNYYPSKEKLFMAIYIEENIKLKKRCMARLDTAQEPLNVIKQLMMLNMAGMQADPILRQWFDKNVYDKLERLFREENGADTVDFMYDIFLDLVKKWQAEGKMRDDMDSEMIMMLFAAIINIETHKEEIGLKYFPQLLDYMAEFVMKGLTDTR